MLVSGLSKAYSSLAAFLTCPPELKRLLKTAAPPYLYSGPSPIASLATVLAGLDMNEKRGDAIRADLWRRTAAVLDKLDRLGVHTPNRSGFPIIEVPLARHEDTKTAGSANTVSSTNTGWIDMSNATVMRMRPTEPIELKNES